MAIEGIDKVAGANQVNRGYLDRLKEYTDTVNTLKREETIIKKSVREELKGLNIDTKA
jgi:hypothetical protein